VEAAGKKYKKILETYETPDLPADVNRDLQKYIEKMI
jgi:trimethylamine:corrinoid methyltransferase-like protein